MSFVCELCGKNTPAGTSMKKVVTSCREYHHPYRPRAMNRKVEKNGKKKREWLADAGGFGTQIVHEARACPGCAAERERQQLTTRVEKLAVPVKIVVDYQDYDEITPERKPYRAKNSGPRPPRTNNSDRKPRAAQV